MSGFWADDTNRCWYLNWLARQLKLNSREDWMLVTSKQLRANNGNGIMAKMSVTEIREAGAALVGPKPQTATGATALPRELV